MLIRHASDGKMYLYDMVNTKKKQVPRLGIKPYGNKLASFRYNIVERVGKVKNEHS